MKKVNKACLVVYFFSTVCAAPGDSYPSFGTDWVTQTVYVTLSPGITPTTQTAVVTQTPSGTNNVITETIYVTQPTTITATLPGATQTDTVYESSSTCWWNCDSTLSETSSTTTSKAKPTKTPQTPPAQQALARPCLPGDQNESVSSGPLRPTRTQTASLIAIGVYIIAILVGWSLIGIRTILYPLKLLVTAWHELGHAIGAVAAGGRLKSVAIDPNEGGMVTTEDGSYPRAALPMGFVFNIIIGGLLTFAGFDTLASKVASFFIGIVFFWATGILSQVLIVGALGLMIGLWFIDHASILRYYILFIGVMSSWYVVFDFADDVVFRKPMPSCSRLWHMANPKIPVHIWALIWTGISVFVFILFIIAALAAWRLTPHGMYCQSQQFLPT